MSETLERRTITHLSEGRVQIRMQVVGSDGGVEFVFNCYPEPLSRYEESSWQASGFEYHWKRHSKPDYFKDEDEAPHNDCTITGGECWHDGTSLWASEHWMPLYRAIGPEATFEHLEAQYRKTFEAQPEDSQ